MTDEEETQGEHEGNVMGWDPMGCHFAGECWGGDFESRNFGSFTDEFSLTNEREYD